MQEVLNFTAFKSISFKRPADEVLFSSTTRPADVLRKLRSTLPGIEGRGDEGEYEVTEN